MKKTLLTIGICLLLVFEAAAVGFDPSGPKLKHGCLVTLSLVEHKAYTDTSGWKFQGHAACTTAGKSSNFTLSASWNNNTKKALESISGTNDANVAVTGAVTSTCPADPWLNNVACNPDSGNGNFLEYFALSTIEKAPLSALALTPAQKALFKAEAAAKGPHPAPPPPPPPPPHPAPIVQSPAAGQVFNNPDTVLISIKAILGQQIPADITSWKFNFKFEKKEAGVWTPKGPSFINLEPNGGVNFSVKLSPGTWRLQAQTSSPKQPNGSWSNWVEFTVKLVLGILPVPSLPVLSAPTIVSPSAGQLFSSAMPINIQVKPPSGTAETKVKLEFQHLTNNVWITKAVLQEYDVNGNPNGVNVNYLKFGTTGSWQVKARMATPAAASWSGWVQFKIK